MAAIHLVHLALLATEAGFVAVLLLLVFRLRHWLGLSLLFIVMGSFQLMQTLLAQSIYVEVGPGILTSPGSAVLFTANLFAVLLVYLRETTNDARRLIYGILAANLIIATLMSIFRLVLHLPGTHNFLPLPEAVFAQNPRLVLVGTTALFLDFLLLVLCYETLSRLVPRWVTLRVFGAMTLVLAFDTLFFATGGFFEKPEFLGILVSGFVGKTVASLVYSAILVFYVRIWEREEFLVPREAVTVGGILRVLTFQQDHEQTRSFATRDAATGLFNRLFFDDALPAEVERSARFGRPTSLLRIGIDDMRGYRAKHGRVAVERAEAVVGTTINETVRTSDIPARLAPGEFAVILVDADQGRARREADAIRVRIVEIARAVDPPLAAVPTLTIGCCSFPMGASTVDELRLVAEQRLAMGRAAGGDRIIEAQF